MVNQTRVEHHIDTFERESGLRVSPMARHLILLSLDAIERDPNPNWGVPMEALESYADKIAYEVPDLLRGVAEYSVRGSDITYFNVLHYLTRNLKVVCPFPSK